MTNADKFKSLFGLYATELWAMPEKDFLKWLNSEAMNCSEFPNNSDTISRQAAIDAMAELQGRASSKGELTGISKAWKRIKKLPPIQPEPKEGHWIRRDCGLDVECKCSVCGYKDFVEPHDTYWFKRNYCPNCGAKMKGATP